MQFVGDLRISISTCSCRGCYCLFSDEKTELTNPPCQTPWSRLNHEREWGILQTKGREDHKERGLVEKRLWYFLHSPLFYLWISDKIFETCVGKFWTESTCHKEYIGYPESSWRSTLLIRESPFSVFFWTHSYPQVEPFGSPNITNSLWIALKKPDWTGVNRAESVFGEWSQCLEHSPGCWWIHDSHEIRELWNWMDLINPLVHLIYGFIIALISVWTNSVGAVGVGCEFAPRNRVPIVPLGLTLHSKY